MILLEAGEGYRLSGKIG
jgi:beta-lactamase class D